MDAEKTGVLIAQARKEKELAQRELAERLHVSVQAVSKWERGRSCPDISLLEPLAEILELTVTELLSGQRGEEPKEESVRDSLRFGLDQLGPKVRRWRWLFVLAALALAGVLLRLGYVWVRDNTELLPQTETLLVPIDLAEQQNALVDLMSNRDGNDFLYMYDLTMADDMDRVVFRMELWTPEGLTKSWDLVNMSNMRAVEDFSRHQLTAFRLTLREDGNLQYRIRVGNTIGSGERALLEETPYLGNGMGWGSSRLPAVVDRESGVVLLEIYLTEDPTLGVRCWYENLKEGTAALVLRLCWQ